ncbi:biotin transporter BioY [Erysipelothrix sp. HDW6C]|uniref:biotin transporter BioY n=1 Tax=Erysipelothrix sp. HDW6C TaxID=2714930 RepID=UPI00140A841E|nr:biotin transporter BioY [Erysipelothrix sp. HDW6C]QIK69590.1 biotin transporter BioY [Erysipelothrix sp. HDW6C]
MTIKDLTLSALFACFIAIGALITIPIPVIPFTLQVFALSLTAVLLTRKQAFFAVITYILMGLLGLPIFSGGRGGLEIVASPTFGFILGFIPMVLVINTLFHKISKPIAFLCGSLVLYAIALPILYFNLKFNAGVTLPLSKLVVSYWLMFLPTDFISMGLSYLVAKRMPKRF